MDREKMFTVENLIFASQHEGVIGSLYFRAKEGENIYRGRIRLCHEHGPKISLHKNSEKHWMLGDKDWYNSDGKSGICYGDLVPQIAATLDKARNNTIYEIYSNSDHASRGKLVIINVTQNNIDEIILKISEYATDNGKCKNENICKANKALIDLLEKHDKLKQKEGVYGC